jgi:FtsZ-binding cell division protein ZapB
MLHPGEVGPSEELLRLKAIVETLESKSQQVVETLELVETLESKLHAAYLEVHKTKHHESVLMVRQSVLMAQVDELRAENARLKAEFKDTMVV